MHIKRLWKTVLFIAVIITMILYSGCSENEEPVELFNQYADAWSKMDFDTMYDLISSQNKIDISRSDFINAYWDFYNGIKVQSVTLQLLESEDELNKQIRNGESDSLPVSVELNTEYGIKSYETRIILVEEDADDKKEWKILWDYNLIYDGFEEGDTVHTSITSMPVRGEILDRNGKKLAENGVAIQVGIVPGRLGDMKDQIIKELSETFDISEQYINDRLELSWVKDDTFVDLKKIPKDQQNLIEAIHAKNPGATYMEIEERVYPYKDTAAHLTGYLGYMNEEELEEWEKLGFTANDRIGRSGLEYIFNESLMGKPGSKISIVNKEGKEKEVLFEQETVNGEDLRLTIDIDLQAKLYKYLQGEPGTAAVMNYKTGEILALVSSPSYDPNRFILGIGQDELKELQENKDKPLLNRFTQVYSPGSTFKPITAAIALNEKIVDKNYTIDVEGFKWQKDTSWGNHYVTRVKDPGRPIDMEKAMVYSDNIYFAQLALMIGGDTFIQKAKDFGIGEPLPLRYGVKDSQLANEARISNDVLLADTGYGQGEILVNILNLNKAYSVFVNEGNIVNPRLIADNADPDKKKIISEETAGEIFDFLIQAVENEEGTGHDAYIPGKTLAGKTGTAEVPGDGENNGLDELGWFVAIDKNENTPYIISLMIENAKDKGGSKAAVEKVRNFIIDYSNN